MSTEPALSPSIAAPHGSTHLVSSFKTPDFAADTVRVGDLNGDGGRTLPSTCCACAEVDLPIVPCVPVGQMNALPLPLASPDA